MPIAGIAHHALVVCSSPTTARTLITNSNSDDRTLPFRGTTLGLFA
jgi:hypothetical protein